MSKTLKVNIKWNKKNYEVEIGDSLELVQAQLYSLTHVPPDRQKILCRGKQIKVDGDLAKIKPKSKLMMMGSADELAAPTKKYIFEEDLTTAQKAEILKENHSGLNNLGNTCYMNSTVQCLRFIPELKNAIKKFAADSSVPRDEHALMVRQMGEMFNSLDRTSEPITPLAFVTTFRKNFPQFAQRGESGAFMQQDADECLMTFMQVAGSKLSPKYGGLDPNAKENVIKQLFGFRVSRSLKCSESEEEEEKTKEDTAQKLSCHIDEKTNFLVQGIENSLDEVVELKSAKLGRNAQYKQTTRLLSLPKYLVVQFVRFYWKKSQGKKCKMLRKVKFPVRLDVESFCEPALRKSIGARRMKDKEARDKELGLDSLQVEKKAKTGPKGEAMEVEAPKVEPADTTGFYQLFGVVTHKGRDADSGHYIGWVHEKGEEWSKYDDAKVSPCKEEDILNLCGGGDWHTAYMVYYKRLDTIPKEEPKNKKKGMK